VRVVRREREPVTGRRQVRLRVPYLGYAPRSEETGAVAESDGDGPAGSSEDPRPGASRSEPLAPVDGWGGKGDASAHAPRAEDEDFPF
jgi:hypothetical protein